ncbi:hypothetical protein EAF00_002234 [Botryotinia globosa]|nr:hypothetical protein EAF00_002234 [Botryotinia globosa]
MPAIRGCVQAPMVLQDSSFEKMDINKFHAATKPKVDGSWNLHALLPALIVDAYPGSQAAKANSFASIAVIIGSAIGYGCAFIEMPKGPAWLTNPQFKGLYFIASISLGITVTITSVMIEEKAFCAWLAWFPFLFNLVLFLSRLYEF